MTELLVNDAPDRRVPALQTGLGEQGSHLREVLRDRATLVYLTLTASVPVLRPGIITIGGQPVTITDIALVTLYGIVLFRSLTGRLRLRLDGLFFASVGYIAILAASILASGHLFSKASLKLVAYAAFVLLPWLSRHVVTTERGINAVAEAWTVGVGLTVALGILAIALFYIDRDGAGQHLLCGYGGLPSGNYPRLCRPFPTPNMFLNYLTHAAPIALAWTFLHWGTRKAVVAIGICGIAAVFTLSAGMGGLMLACAIVIWTVRRNQGIRRGAIDILLAASTGIALIFFLSTMLVSTGPRGYGDFDVGPRGVKVWDGVRTPIWSGTLPTIAAHPILGAGYGTLVAETSDPRAFMPPDQIKLHKGTFRPHKLEAHDIWLNVLGQAGVVGLSAFVLLLASLTHGWLWRSKPQQSAELRLWRAACVGAFAGGVLFHGIFGAFEEARHVWVLLSFAVTVTAAARREIDKAQGPVSPRNVQTGQVR